MKNKKNSIIRISLICSFILLLMIIVCDMRLKTVTYKIKTDKVNSNITIALLTDLHGEWYGRNQSTLLTAVAKTSPDIVLLGGDIFDDNREYNYAEFTLKALSEEYPCYYVTGNHEYWSNDIQTILSVVESCNVTILSGECVTPEVNGQQFNLCGIDDPDALVYLKQHNSIHQQLKNVNKATSNGLFTILLSHRPELIDSYLTYDFDLILSGHAHGGQWRIPFLLNGLFAPNQGLFPEYAGGRYDYENSTMIVSRGLSRITTAIPRIFNRPELIVVEIVPIDS